MKITLSKYYKQKCDEFAEEQMVTSADYYRYRGEKNMQKMLQDISIGKLGEVAAYEYVRDLGYDVKKPDFTIYERRNKSFDADLSTKCGLKIHVKAQGKVSISRYGLSWLLQKSDKLVKEPQANECLLFCSVDGDEVEILGTVWAKDIADMGLYEEPVVPMYARTKVALYYETLEDSKIYWDVI